MPSTASTPRGEAGARPELHVEALRGGHRDAGRHEHGSGAQLDRAALEAGVEVESAREGALALGDARARAQQPHTQDRGFGSLAHSAGRVGVR